jgi:hypothetical protein
MNMRPTHCPETSLRNQQGTQRNNIKIKIPQNLGFVIPIPPILSLPVTLFIAIIVRILTSDK